jgi:ABC-type bacteriocin/lantibiotic exporter with double-glycine peptidase domain
MTNENQTKRDKRQKMWKALPDIWVLIKPRRGLLALGFVLMAINRVSGLVLPASTKYFLDDVIGKKHAYLLTPIVLSILGATLV